MMFGFRDEFAYFECSRCGCLQIKKIPENMERYYPSAYYSFKKPEGHNFMKNIAIRKRDEYALFKKSLIGKIFYKKYPHFNLHLISLAGITCNSKILDVGCGSGRFIYALKNLGIKDLTGVDPYISNEITNGNLRILKKKIFELPNNIKFDIIIFNHSFEHITDQLATLNKVSRILTEKGVCLILMPVKTESIWNRYGKYWIQIDAPRHFIVHTLNSFDLLAKKANLIIQDIKFNSTDFQFWGSEQYKRNVSLYAKKSHLVNSRKSIFIKTQINEYRRMAENLNKNKQGDQAAFYLRRR